MRPSVAIVTPSYNQARYLEEAIRSVEIQGAEVSEYLVLDGGSSDESREVIRRHQHAISYWTSEPDGGQANAIDAGFRLAKSDIVGWLNSDDVLLPGAIQRVRESFAARPNLQVLLGWCVFIDTDSRVIRVRRHPPQTRFAAEWGITRIGQPACFFRRELYSRVGGINRSLTCVLDTDLWYRMLDYTPEWGHTPHVLAGFRIHPASKGQSWGEAYARELGWLEREHPRYAGQRVKHAVGRFGYRLHRLLTLGHLRDLRDTARWGGRPLAEYIDAQQHSA